MAERISRELILKVMAILANRAAGHSVRFEIAGTRNYGILQLEKGNEPGKQVYLATGAMARDDDHLVRNYLHHTASMEEMSRWLRDAGNAGCIIDSLEHLSDRVDEGFD